MALDLVPVNIASLCAESVFYGIFCTLSILSLHLLIKAAARADGQYSCSRPMLIFSVLIFLVVTAHWFLSAVRIFQAFFLYHGGQNPEVFLSDISQLSAVLREGIFLGLLVISDLAIVYRLWAVWCHHRGVMVIPVILLIGMSTLAALTLREWFAPNTNLLQNPGEFQTKTFVWINALYITTFSINVYSTGMIALKLGRAGRTIQRSQSTFITVILVESLSLNSIWGVFFLTCYWLGSFLYIPVSETQCPITGIAFMILHVRVGLQRLSCNDSASIESGHSREDHGPGCSEG